MIMKAVILGFVLAGAYAAAEAVRTASEFVVTSLASTEADATYAARRE